MADPAKRQCIIPAVYKIVKQDFEQYIDSVRSLEIKDVLAINARLAQAMQQ
jgi:hypothetical protein